MKGQILPASPLGRRLVALAASSQVVVEIGSWWGGGSTRALVAGLPEGGKLFTVEQDASCYQVVADAYRGDERVVVILGAASEVADRLPEKIDLLLLDGGEETTDGDWDLLSPRAATVVLDDIRMRKNRRQWQVVEESPEWSVVECQPEDRNGWLVARRML